MDTTPGPSPTPQPAPQPPPPPTPIDSFGDFYEALQDRACPLAVGECSSAAEALDCVMRLDTPACDDFNVIAAELCLGGPFICGDQELLEASTACEEVCSNISFLELGLPLIPESCLGMLLCDEALSDASNGDFTQAFGGIHDVAYGQGGSCYQGDAQACSEACAEVFSALAVVADTLISSGDIDFIPAECG